MPTRENFNSLLVSRSMGEQPTRVQIPMATKISGRSDRVALSHEAGCRERLDCGSASIESACPRALIISAVRRMIHTGLPCQATVMSWPGARPAALASTGPASASARGRLHAGYERVGRGEQAGTSNHAGCGQSPPAPAGIERWWYRERRVDIHGLSVEQKSGQTRRPLSTHREGASLPRHRHAAGLSHGASCCTRSPLSSDRRCPPAPSDHACGGCRTTTSPRHPAARAHA